MHLHLIKNIIMRISTEEGAEELIREIGDSMNSTRFPLFYFGQSNKMLILAL